MRVAALGLSAVLTVGALAPFVGTSSASAVECSVANGNYASAAAKLDHDKAKLHHWKKALRKAKRHHKSHAVIRHDKKKVTKFRHKVHRDRQAVSYAKGQRDSCTNGTTLPGGGTNPAGSVNPMSSLLDELQQGLTPAQLSTLPGQLQTAVDQLGASTAPGASPLADLLKQLSDALANGGSIDPAKAQAAFQQLTDALGGSLSPAQLQAVLTTLQGELTKAASNPPSTPQGIVDAILGGLYDGLTAANVPALPGAVQQLNTTLDGLLAPIALP
ncbi:MAG TPA: hypothetical protein VFR99_06750 [Marmoricola sp.]|nr:hypothetical protein [Marmoricola sp.]